MHPDKLAELIQGAIDNKASVIIVNNTYNSGISASDAQAMLSAIQDDEQDLQEHGYSDPVEQARAEVISLGIKNLMEWIQKEVNPLYNCIAKAAIQDNSLGLFVRDFTIMSYMTDAKFMEEFSEQVLLKTGLNHICLVNLRGEIFWETDCITATTPFKQDTFKHLPIQGDESNNYTEVYLDDNHEEDDDEMYAEFKSVMASKSINFLDLFSHMPDEIKEASIPLLLAIDAVRHATADWYHNEFRTSDTPPEELQTTATNIFNKSVEDMMKLCRD